jgi:formylglycine-generating enzyme required for sulfatase activity
MPQAADQFSGIFICYRRDESAGHAGRLYDRLAAHFGGEQVFMDIDYIEPGEDFVQAIEDAVGSCEVLIALVGRNWPTSRNESGRRLDNPNDFVRLEIGAALARDVRVIPVLVQGAQMPGQHDLPEDIVSLSRRHAFEISDVRWNHDVDQLISVVEKIRARRREARRIAEEEEAERQRREAEAQRQEESERLKQAAAEAEQRKQEAEEAERRRREAEEAERRRSAALPPAAVEDVPRTAHSEKPAIAVTPGQSIARKRSRPTRIIAATALLLAVGFMLLWLWASKSGNKTASAGSPPPAREQQGADDRGGVNNSSPQVMSEPQAPPKMIYVPGGKFLMGNDAGDEYEKPAHIVAVTPFFIDQYEVTNEEYAEFVKETNHKPPQTWKKGTYANDEARHPVTGVTWDDANDYAEWAGKRLPTEEEWEFAARGTDGRRYPWGDEWIAGAANAGGASHGVVDVGSYPRGVSPFGAFDMVGNAWEWTDTGAPAQKGYKRLKVIRGCMYECDKEHATATSRRPWPANGLAARYYSNTGFRCAKDATK